MPARVKEQLPLALRYNASGQTRLRDAAAAENKTLPVHRWVPWIAGFAAHFVEDAIRSYLPQTSIDEQLVLDPFAGVGTTLVEALKTGRPAFGHEINAFAVLAARAKVNCVEANPRIFRARIAEFHSRLGEFEMRVDRQWMRVGAAGVQRLSDSNLRQEHIQFKSRIPFFSPPVEAKFRYAVEAAASLRPPYRDLFLVALGATMVSFSNYTYEPSLSSRPGAGRPLIENAAVASIVTQKLDNMLEDIELMLSRHGSQWRACERSVDASSYFESRLRHGQVSLVVTSPPYMNNYHYLRNTRPQLHWLGLIGESDALAKMEEASFGKFWQTVRQGPLVELNAPVGASLAQAIEKLRETNVVRRPYGGAGWANYVATYLNDCDRFLLQTKKHLRHGARAVIVVGNSIIQGIEFRVDQVLAELAEGRGLVVEDIILVRKKRVGNSIIDSTVRNGNGSHKKRTQLYDAAVILRR